MKIIPALSIPFYEFECKDQAMLDKVTEEVAHLPFDDNDPPPSTRPYFHPDLFVWFADCVEEVRKLYYKDTINLIISTGFATRIKRMQKARLHHHINSIISGIFYINSTESSKTKFIMPNPYYFVEHQKVLHISKNSTDIIDQFYDPLVTTIFPNRGRLVLFPSYIDHETLTHTENFYRHIISFNTMASGVISEKSTIRLDLQTKPYLI